MNRRREQEDPGAMAMSRTYLAIIAGDVASHVSP
jgi:hypothetical protein